MLNANHGLSSNIKTHVSSGTPIAGVEIKILGDDRKGVKKRILGEIAVKSPSLMSGYFNNPSETQKCIVDGWLLTGDIGYLVKDDLYVVGRKKDIIIYLGKNIFPQDIEEIVNQISGTIPGRCVALGIYDENLGSEQIIVLAEIYENSQHINHDIHYQIRHEVFVQTGIPLQDVKLIKHMALRKSTSGKISRNLNKKLYLTKLINLANSN